MLTTDTTTSEQPLTETQLLEKIEHLEAQLDQAQRMSTLGELLSTTTHEFNNVLMSMINYARLAMRQHDETVRQRTLQKVLDAGSRATKITNSILSAARNRSGAFEACDLSQIIDDTIILVERELRKYRIQIVKQISEVPATMARGNELQQVLLNLVINARQAMPNGGEVLIRLSHDPESKMNELMIRDSGKGIPSDKLSKIFEPFFTTKSGPDETGKGGTGLGLAACRDIIEAHKGRIRVASTEGKGTAFTLKLPAIIGSASGRP